MVLSVLYDLYKPTSQDHLLSKQPTRSPYFLLLQPAVTPYSHATRACSSYRGQPAPSRLRPYHGWSLGLDVALALPSCFYSTVTSARSFLTTWLKSATFSHPGISISLSYCPRLPATYRYLTNSVRYFTPLLATVFFPGLGEKLFILFCSLLDSHT